MNIFQEWNYPHVEVEAGASAFMEAMSWTVNLGLINVVFEFDWK